MEGHYDLGNAELAQRYPEAKIIVNGGNYRRVYVPYCYAHLTLCMPDNSFRQRHQ
jgi:hypothetical protein